LPTVHRAIFGEVKGAHDLIAASPDSPEGVLADLASRYTDRLLPAQISWKPYSCGLPVRGHYVITRTFPVKATRSGMVQTHAVIVPLDALNDMPLECLFDLLPAEPQFPVVEPTTVELSENFGSASTETAIPPGYPSLVRMLLNGRVPIWLGQDHFEDIVRFLWHKLWPEARRDFKFRISAEPNDILDLPATLVCTPAELRSNWKSQQFVDFDLKASPNTSLSESLLFGLPDGEGLRNLRKRLGVFPAQLAGLRRLEQYVNMLAQDTPDSIGTAVRLMKFMFPEPAQCGAEKARLLNLFAQKTVNGIEQDVIALRNLDVSAFSQGYSSVQQMISEWVAKQVSHGQVGVTFSRAVLLEVHPWKQVADEAMFDAFETWSANHARVLWHWWVSDPVLIAPSSVLIPKPPDGVEKDLLQTRPANIPSSARAELLKLCSERHFYLLGSAILSDAADLSVVEKLKTQLNLFVDPLQEAGLPEIATLVSGAELVDAALIIQDARIVDLAGLAVTRQPDLLAGMNARDLSWRAIWISALEKGQDLFDGITQPNLVANDVFDTLLGGSIIESALVERLAITQSSDLINYRRRSEVWGLLSETARRESISTAAQAWLSRFPNEASLGSKDLEPELENEIIRLWRSTPSLLSAVSLLEFWQLFSSTLTETDFVNWLSHNSQMTPLEAIGIGKLIHENSWPEATRDVIRRARCGRSDLLPTVHQLWSNVALWDKLHFSVFTSEPVMKEDEWWEAFYDLSIRLYAYGVQQNNIWTEADGDGSRVKSGTGREQWHDALNLLRNGGAGGTMTIEGLLHQMRHDYHSNSELQLLENVYLTKIKGSW
jgi:hypothetical protein